MAHKDLLVCNNLGQGFLLKATESFDVYKLGPRYVIRVAEDDFRVPREVATHCPIEPGSSLIDGGYVKSLTTKGAVVQYGQDEAELPYDAIGVRLCRT